MNSDPQHETDDEWDGATAMRIDVLAVLHELEQEADEYRRRVVSNAETREDRARLAGMAAALGFAAFRVRRVLEGSDDEQ